MGIHTSALALVNQKEEEEEEGELRNCRVDILHLTQRTYIKKIARKKYIEAYIFTCDLCQSGEKEEDEIRRET